MPILSAKLLFPVDIIVDSREASKNSDIVDSLKEKGVRVAVLELGVGDYYLLSASQEGGILVERKTVLDFANSIRDNRVWDQVKRLKEAAEQEKVEPLILIEGCLELVEKKTGWNTVAILRVIDEIILDWGVHIMFTHSKQATIAWLAAKAKSLGETREKKVYRLRVEKKPLSINERIVYVAEGIVGPILARRLLKRFGTLRNIANASIKELMSVEGIGEKRAKEIYDIFNTPWNPADENSVRQART